MTPSCRTWVQTIVVVVVLMQRLTQPGWCAHLDPAAKEEANLRCITFIDPDRGWVAGERGVILNTEDGGLTWRQQPAATEATLTSIGMYNSQRGIAIGGQYEPHSRRSIGEVLTTKDGGKSWQVMTGHDLPRLRQMILGEGGRCVAVGDWSPVHLASVFVSDDGGFTWRPRICHASGPMVGIAGNCDDFLTLQDSGEVIRFRFDAEPLTTFPATDGWKSLVGNSETQILAGPGGMIRSLDQGQRWEAIQEPMDAPGRLATTKPFAATSLGTETWLCGESSTAITRLRREQSGATAVESIEHQGDAALRALLRLDQDRGWAVGDYGLILATRDGGRTWRAQRGGQRSAAVLCVGATSDSLPWSLAAQESFQYQRRVALTTAHTRTTALEPSSAAQADTLRDAACLLGPCSVLDSLLDQREIQAALRLIKPAVVLLDQNLAPEIREAWTSSAIQAGAARVLEYGDRGTQTVHVTAAMASVGALASDVWISALARLSPGQLPPAKLMLRPRFDATNSLLAGDGLAGYTRSERRYGWASAATPSRRQLQVLQARLAEESWVESLVAKSNSLQDYNATLKPVLLRMTTTDRERLFMRLLALTVQHQRHDLYMSTLQMVAELDAAEKSDFVRLAKLRQQASSQSAEWNHAISHAFVTAPVQANSTQAPASVDMAVQWSPFQTDSTNAGQTATMSPAQDNPAVKQAALFTTSSSDLVQQAAAATTRRQPAAVDLRWEFHPAVMMVGRSQERKAAQENLKVIASGTNPASPERSQVSTMESHLQRLAMSPAAGSWGCLAANNEHPGGIAAPLATTRPYLDGLFNEPWWTKPNSLSARVSSEDVLVHFGHDDQFLYVAIDSPRLNDRAAAVTNRQRDTPLDHADRIRLRIDVDRDLLTAFEFEFDHAGNTRDTCDGFAIYQPRWFIACVHDEQRTRAEIAIQKSDLSHPIALGGAVFNVSVERVSQPATRGLQLPQPQDWRPIYLR